MTGTVVVTGALGNVGSAVVARLLDLDVRVRPVDVDADALTNAYPTLETRRLDFWDPATFPDVLSNATKVFLIRPPAISRVGPTLNRFIDAAQDAGIRHVVFSSVAGADTNRIVPHHRVEVHLRSTAMAWTMLRPGFFAQNIGTAYRSDIIETNRIPLPAGKGKVAFIDTRDIGAVAAKTLASDQHLQREYHLTGPTAMTFADVAGLLSIRLGRTITYQPISSLRYYQHLRRQGLVRPHALVQTLLHAGLRRGDAEPVSTTIAALLERPATTIDTYITDHIHLWQTEI